MSDLVQDLISLLHPGDMVLTGGTDPISLLIQVGSRSPFSHVALANDHDELTEAYDYALTPDESDEGIFRLPVHDFVARSDSMCRVQVLRPIGIDQDRVVETCQYLLNHSPGFPTIGMAFLALCGLSSPVLQRLPANTRRRITMAQVRLASDGIQRMHCAETVTRIYHEAGLTVRFTAPRLSFHIAELGGEITSQLVDLPQLERTASKGTWPAGPQPLRAAKATGAALRSLGPALRQRIAGTDQFDLADLILPGDFARAEPFENVARFEKTGRAWARAA